METRLEKYKNYRESLKEMKTVSQTPEAVVDRQSKTVTETLNTTSTLPLEDVVGKINEEPETNSRRLFTKKSLTIIGLSIVGLIIVAAIIIIAINIF